MTDKFSGGGQDFNENDENMNKDTNEQNESHEIKDLGEIKVKDEVEFAYKLEDFISIAKLDTYDKVDVKKFCYHQLKIGSENFCSGPKNGATVLHAYRTGDMPNIFTKEGYHKIIDFDFPDNTKVNELLKELTLKIRHIELHNAKKTTDKNINREKENKSRFENGSSGGKDNINWGAAYFKGDHLWVVYGQLPSLAHVFLMTECKCDRVKLYHLFSCADNQAYRIVIRQLVDKFMTKDSKTRARYENYLLDEKKK